MRVKEELFGQEADVDARAQHVTLLGRLADRLSGRTESVEDAEDSA